MADNYINLPVESGGGGGGVPSVNGITSAVTIAGGGSTTVGTAGGTITVSSPAFDLMSHLVSSIVSVTTGTTLNSSAFGKLHSCSGTSADYTVTLPAVSGNSGKIIGFTMAQGLTKFVTIQGNGAELIDGLNTRLMHNGETAFLLCDGSAWTKIAGKSIPFVSICRYGTGSINQYNYVASVANIIPLDTATYDPNNLLSVADSAIMVPRPATYSLNSQVTAGNDAVVAGALFEASGVDTLGNIIGGATIATGYTYGVGVAAAEFQHFSNSNITAGTLLQIRVYSSVSCTSRPFDGSEPYLAITEILVW